MKSSWVNSVRCELLSLGGSQSGGFVFVSSSGELLASPLEAVHFFEPFWYCDTHDMPITKDMHLTPDKSYHRLVQRYLIDMLNCRSASPGYDAG